MINMTSPKPGSIVSLDWSSMFSSSMSFIRMRTSCLILLAAVFGLGQSQKCIPLNECPALAYLHQNLGQLSGPRKVGAFKYLNEIRCGFIGSTDLSLVNCPPLEGNFWSIIIESN